MTDFKAIVLAMTERLPNARVSTVVELALAAEAVAIKPELDDPRQLAAWAKTQPAVTAEIAADRKIHAIKELRAVSGASLKQAKDAIDVLAAPR